MNKLVAVLLLVLGVAAVHVAAGKGHHEKAMKECQEQEKATDDDVKNMKTMKPYTTREGKCFVGCMFEKLGLLENGAFSKKNSDKWIEKKFSDDKEKQQQAKNAMAGCEADLAGVPKEKCETGPVLRECIARIMRQHHKKGDSE